MKGDTTSDDERKNITNGRERKNNFAGVIHQQGRHLLDSDWNAQTKIVNEWHGIAGKDAISSKFAAIPLDDANGFKVNSAIVSDGQVVVTVTPGRAWVKGILLYLDGINDVSRIAFYLQPPIQNPPATVASISDGIRDALILEVWHEEINGFQIPDLLIEPAIGGPDTTERIHIAAAFKLLRLAPDENCESILPKINDDLSLKGKLTVSLEPITTIQNDCNCPTISEGGYTGFEHNLYRIELANSSMFKWSQLNGGLVGRGIFDPVKNKVTIIANFQAIQAIMRSGVDRFYLEAVEYDDAHLGRWQVTFGCMALLNPDGTLDLSTTPIFGQIPTTSNSVFFRLWNGIEKISDYIVDPPKLLVDGIHLKFASDSNLYYQESDYWTFSVRAGDIPNPQILINNQPAIWNSLSAGSSWYIKMGCR